MPVASPSVIGARAEMAVASALTRAGMSVYLPCFAPHSRVDLVVDRGDELVRVQCKSGRVIRGAVYFPTCSNTANTPQDYRDEVDVFGVYAPALEAVYLVPIEDTPSRGCCLRIEPPRNGQRSGVRWAADYLVGPP